MNATIAAAGSRRAAHPTKWRAFSALFHKELLIYRRDRLLLIMLFVVPTVLTLFLAPALSGAASVSGPAPRYVAAGRAGPVALERLGRPTRVTSLEHAREQVADGSIQFALVTPRTGAPYVIADPVSPGALSVFLNRLSGDRVRIEAPDGGLYRSESNPYQQALIGLALLNVFFAAAHAAQAIHRERTWGTWNRVLSLPLGKASILFAKLLPIALLATIQELVLIGGGSRLAGIPVHRPEFLVLGAIGVGLTVAGAAALLAAVAANDQQVPQFNNLLTLLGGTLAGALVPVALMPAWAQVVAPAFPQYWALQLFAGASRGAPSGALFTDLAVLLGFAAAFGLIGLKAMRWQRFRHD